MVNTGNPVTMRYARLFPARCLLLVSGTGECFKEFGTGVLCFTGTAGTGQAHLQAVIMTKTITFDEANDVADMLIRKASKEQLAECARLLALNLAYHQIRQGELPVDETLAQLRSFELNDEQLALLMEGMLNLIGVLVNVCGGVGQARH